MKMNFYGEKVGRLKTNRKYMEREETI